jgi:hypothetical protein
MEQCCAARVGSQHLQQNCQDVLHSLLLGDVSKHGQEGVHICRPRLIQQGGLQLGAALVIASNELQITFSNQACCHVCLPRDVARQDFGDVGRAIVGRCASVLVNRGWQRHPESKPGVKAPINYVCARLAGGLHRAHSRDRRNTDDRAVYLGCSMPAREVAAAVKGHYIHGLSVRVLLGHCVPVRRGRTRAFSCLCQ